MDCLKIGNLLLRLRKEKGITQQSLAAILNVSDRTISKWERGIGCPDISLLRALSSVFNIHIEKILLGDLEANELNGGNMKKTKFYTCSECTSTLCSTGNSEISCCGRKLQPLVANSPDKDHQVSVEKIENDFYITLYHAMSKEHYISFAAYVTYDRVLLIKLYPEQDPTVRFPQMTGGILYVYCSAHGLIKYDKLNN